MSRALTRLAERRRPLLAQSAAQRVRLAHELQPWRARLAVADEGMAVLRYLRSHPLLIAGAALLFVAWRPRSAGLWLRRGWVAWQVGRGLISHRQN